MVGCHDLPETNIVHNIHDYDTDNRHTALAPADAALSFACVRHK